MPENLQPEPPFERSRRQGPPPPDFSNPRNYSPEAQEAYASAQLRRQAEKKNQPPKPVDVNLKTGRRDALRREYRGTTTPPSAPETIAGQAAEDLRRQEQKRGGRPRERAAEQTEVSAKQARADVEQAYKGLPQSPPDEQ